MNGKGVLSKSIANNISEAIIDKLGGSGYAPTEWSRNINLLGIASADIEEALASITEDTSSADKGLLSLSIASDVGAMLNKKYNTSRGFKPCEVSSAVSALTVLPEKTASSAPICIFNDGADDVPLKSCEVALPPSLDGYSNVDVVQMGKNLLNFPNFTLNFGVTNSAEVENLVNFPAGQYTITFDIPTNTTVKTVTFVIRDKNGAGATQQAISYISAGSTASKTVTFTATVPFNYFYCYMSSSETTGNTITIENIMMVSGATSSPYVSPTAPTTHTASLGRTIQGGSVDAVKGEGTDSYDRGSMSSTYLSGLNSDYIGYEASTAYFGGHPSVWVRNWNYQRAKARQSGGIGCICNYFPMSMHNTIIFSAQYRIYFDVNEKNISSVADFIAFVQNLEANNESLDIVYELNDTYTTDFAFEPVEISSKLGSNTMWSEQGDTEVTYRADLDLYEAPSTLLGSNNTETEGNEEQEVNE